MWIRVMIPIDGSEESRLGLTVGARLSLVLGAKVTIAHALSTEAVKYKMIPDFQEEMIRDRARAHAQGKLEEARKRLAELGVEADTLLVEGKPGEVVPKAAEKYEMLILGAKVHSDLRDFLLGSVSSDIINHAGKPLLVVKHGGSSLDDLDKSRKVKALLALDDSPASERCIKYLENLDVSSHMELTLLHAVHVKQGLAEEERTNALKRAKDSGQAMLEADAKRLTAAGYSVSTEILEGDAADLACRIHDQDDFDIIIIGKPDISELKERIFDSVCHHLFHHCRAHQLIVP